MSEPKPKLPSVTESPWFWIMLFSLAGLAAVATIGPKFDRREQSIETKFQARERGLGRESVAHEADTPALAMRRRSEEAEADRAARAVS